MTSLTIDTPRVAAGGLSLVARFAWKELRRMGGFALGAAGLAVGVMLLIAWTTPANQHKLVLAAQPLVAMLGAGFVAIGAAVTAFSVEREEETDTFLQSLPRFWGAMFWGKLAGTIAVTVLFAVVMNLVPPLLNRGEVSEYLGGALLIGGAITLNALACGLLVSLVCPRPLLAAVAACGLTSILSMLAMSLADNQIRATNDFTTVGNAALWMTSLAGCLLVVDMGLARRWLLGPKTKPAAKQRRPKFSEMPTSHQTFAMPQQLLPVDSPRRLPIFGRLVWHTLRESWGMMLGVVVVGIFLAIGVGVMQFLFDTRAWGILPIAGLLFVPGLSGAMVFRPEQRRDQYRFLAEHAGRPRLVWLARLVVWGCYLTLVLTVAAVLAYWFLGQMFLGNLQEHSLSIQSSPFAFAYSNQITRELLWWVVVNYVLASYLAFAVGQFVSLLLKSEIVAGGLAVFASMFVMQVAYLTGIWRLPLWWIYLPALFGFLAATYFRLPERLVDRHLRWNWVLVVLLLIVPGTVVAFSIPNIRWAQIVQAESSIEATRQAAQSAMAGPNSVDFRPVAMSNAMSDYLTHHHESERTAAAIRDVCGQLELFDIGGEWIFVGPTDEGHLSLESAIDQLVELSNGPLDASATIDAPLESVVLTLQADAKRLIAAGELDAALGRALAELRYRLALGALEDHGSETLLALATAPGQTSERLKRAATAIGEMDSLVPTGQDIVMARLFEAMKSYEQQDEEQFWGGGDFHLGQFFDTLPGEHARGEAALRVLAALALREQAMVDYLSGAPLREYFQTGQLTHHDTQERWYSGNELATWQQYQLAGRVANTSLLASGYWHEWPLRQKRQTTYRLYNLVWLEQYRLALTAYHLDHGEYPADFGSLVPDYMPKGIPFDKYTSGGYAGQPFGYRPAGFNDPILEIKNNQSQWKQIRVEAGVPVIWSAGPSNYTPHENWTVYAPGNPEEDLGEYLGELNSEGVERESDVVTNFVKMGYNGTDELLLLPLPVFDTTASSAQADRND